MEWTKRLQNWTTASFELPLGRMAPSGYILMQHGERLSRPVQAYKKWADKIPGTYRESVLGASDALDLDEQDPNCLARLKHYRSLVPMAQEVRKPIFSLTTADGAIGSHSYAVRDALSDFKSLAAGILDRIGFDDSAASATPGG